MKPFQSITLLGIALTTLTPKPSLIAESGNPANSRDFIAIQDAIQRGLPESMASTVAVGANGSGVIISEDGLTLTAGHVSEGPDRSMTLFLSDGRRVQARGLGVNHIADIALLQIEGEGPWPFSPLAEADSVEMGDWCYGLGHPGGLDKKRGAALRIGRVIRPFTPADDAILLRSDCQIIGGDSGGPLFNLQGEVIGIHSRISEDSDENYHSPVQAIRETWQTLLDKREIRESNPDNNGFLGVRAEGIRFRHGVRIREIFENTPASQANLRPGDIITHIDELPIRSKLEFTFKLRNRLPGDRVTVTVRRSGAETKVPVTLGQYEDGD